MVKSRLPGVNRVRKRLAGGKIAFYYYHCDTGIRLEGEPDSAEFVASYAAAEAKRGQRLAGRLSGLIREFLASPEFNDGLAESTQREYRRILTRIGGKFDTAPLAAVSDPRFAGDVIAWRDEIASAKPREADNRMIVFGRLLSWAKGAPRHKISVNVLQGYERLYRVDRSDKLWLPEHVAAFQRVASSEAWAGFLIALHTGLRQGDIRRLPWSAYDGTAITLRASKRRRGSVPVKLTIPCTAALRALLDELERREPLILTTKTGRAWQKRYFFRTFDEARAAAAKINPDIADLNFHDLRGTAITMLAEAEATVPMITAITGHSFRTITTILEKYLPRTRHLAEIAIAKLENSGRTDFTNRLQTGPTKRPKERASDPVALPERRVTVHSGDMGYTIGPFAGSARCPGRRVNPWTSV